MAVSTRTVTMFDLTYHLVDGFYDRQHLLVADGMELPRAGNEARVGGEDAVDVGVDLARVRAEGGGERDRRRVGAPAPERGDVVIGRDPLETGDEDDAVGVERLMDSVRAHLDDLRLPVDGVGDDPGL